MRSPRQNKIDAAWRLQTTIALSKFLPVPTHKLGRSLAGQVAYPQHLAGAEGERENALSLLELPALKSLCQ
jgi:hypothetical protein